MCGPSSAAPLPPDPDAPSAPPPLFTPGFQDIALSVICAGREAKFGGSRWGAWCKRQRTASIDATNVSLLAEARCMFRAGPHPHEAMTESLDDLNKILQVMTSSQ